MIDSYKIGRRMDAMGLTQEKLAEIIGVTRKTVNSYLQSGMVKKKHLIKPIANALEVEESWLYPSKDETYIHQHGKDNINQVGESNYGYHTMSNPTSWVDELDRLIKMHDLGMLSDEEFQAAKTKLLS